MACLQPPPPPCLSRFNSNTLSSIIPIKSNSHFRTLKLSNQSNAEPSQQPEPQPPVDPVKSAFEKAKAYKKTKQESQSFNLEQNSDQKDDFNSKEAEDKVDKVKVATEKAREYKKDKGVIGDGNNGTSSGLSKQNGGSSGNGKANGGVGKKNELKLSSIDFVGLDFSEKKKTRGLPAGLIPISDPFPYGEVPEVELIVGDKNKFDNAVKPEVESTQDEDMETYKPKVSTWGVFPRPNNISKTYGGGRVLRPGEELETPEQKAAKEARTRELLAAYKRRIGLSIDPKVKAECEKALKDGDSLMEVGNLEEALPYYEKVMNKVTFKSDLHGFAALQWSICQDSLRRSNEAQVMYEKLQGHPNAQVSKRARQFVFSFQAMEMMKFTSSSFPSENTDYKNYFGALFEDKFFFPEIDAEVEEGRLGQALLYLTFLLSPIVTVLVIAAQKRM